MGQTDCWDIGWRALDQAMPPGEAGALFGEFYAFVRALLRSGEILCRGADFAATKRWL